MKRLILLLSVLGMLSCTRNENMERTFQRAGENRAELEKVLRHYEDDDRKYYAACYLIEHMADCYSYRSDRIDSLMKLKVLATFESREWIDSVDAAWGVFSYKGERKVYDCRVITSDYLINHIDHAFAVWDSRPWSKHYTLDDFCQWVLPYRIADEPLSAWQKPYYEKYAPVLDSLYQGSDVVAATNSLSCMVKEDYFLYNTEFHLPHLGAAYLLEHHLGACRESCDYSVYILRSLGIPVDVDHYRISPEGRGGHSWNVLKDTTGLPVPFWFIETEVSRDWSDKRKKAKVYRYPFGARVQDVTAEYFGENHVAVDVEYTDASEDIRLSVFCRGEYITLDRAELKGGKAHFYNIEPEVRFVPVRKRMGVLEEAGYPFCVTPEGKLHSFVPDTLHRESATLLRKYPPYWGLPKYFNRMAGGKVEGRISKGGSPVWVVSLPDTITTNYHVIPLPDGGIRYLSIVAPRGEHVEIGEVSVLDSSGDTLSIRKVDAPEAKSNTSVSHIGDDDELSYYASSEKDTPVVLDMGKVVLAYRLVFVPRNDDNFIRIGDEYELFYHDGTKGWKSLGRQTAVTNEVHYENIPRNALLWLRDLTRGKEEQVFILRDGKQYFYR